MAKRPCLGCGRLTTGSRCPDCTRGNTTKRGYGNAHQRLRAQWKLVVDAGEGICQATICLKPARWIRPGTPWHLGHTPDRSAWTGPEHAICSVTDGAVRGNQMRRARQGARQWVTSRQW